MPTHAQPATLVPSDPTRLLSVIMEPTKVMLPCPPVLTAQLVGIVQTLPCRHHSSAQPDIIAH
jgi:hypothetical protein